MRLFDLFKKETTPNIQSILPDAAKQEILKGRLPILNTNKIFLKNGEYCHYIEKAIYEKKVVKKCYRRRSGGYSMPGLFKGTRMHLGGGNIDVLDNIHYEHIKGILYITKRRLIFVCEAEGFDKPLDSLIAITPYSNCIELQFSQGNYKIFVPNGNVINAVFQQVK